MIERKPNLLEPSLLAAIVAAICIVCARMLKLPETCISAAPKYTCCCCLEDTQFSCEFFFFFHLGCLVFYGFRQITNISNHRFRITGTSWEHHGNIMGSSGRVPLRLYSTNSHEEKIIVLRL